jgi:hypothetical protein
VVLPSNNTSLEAVLPLTWQGSGSLEKVMPRLGERAARGRSTAVHGSKEAGKWAGCGGTEAMSGRIDFAGAVQSFVVADHRLEPLPICPSNALCKRQESIPDRYRVRTPADSAHKMTHIENSGASCSGKTTLAKHLHSILPNSVLLHQDDYALVHSPVRQWGS